MGITASGLAGAGATHVASHAATQLMLGYLNETPFAPLHRIAAPYKVIFTAQSGWGEVFAHVRTRASAGKERAPLSGFRLSEQSNVPAGAIERPEKGGTDI